jgi:hypothetical protein
MFDGSCHASSEAVSIGALTQLFQGPWTITVHGMVRPGYYQTLQVNKHGSISKRSRVIYPVSTA